MVVKLFGEVENKNVPVPEFPEHPFQEEHLRVSCLTYPPRIYSTSYQRSYDVISQATWFNVLCVLS